MGLALPVSGQSSEEPPAPKPFAVVQKFLDEAGQLLQTKEPQGALAVADRALRVAKGAQDLVGQAEAQQSRARVLQDLGRRRAAVAAWQAAAAAWRRVGDGPGQVEALAAAAALLAAENLAEANQLWTRAVAAGRAEKERPLAAAQALHTAGNAILEPLRLWQARELYSAALAIREEFVPDSLEVAASLNGLGATARDEGNLDAAEDYHRRALAIQQRIAPDSLDVAESLFDLARVARRRGDVALAEQYHRQALAIREKLAPDSLAVAWSLHILGVLAYDRGDMETAHDYVLRALAIRERLAPESLDVADSLHTLGDFAREQGDLESARHHRQRGLAIQEKQAPNSPLVAVNLHDVANLAREQGDLVATLDYLQRMLIVAKMLAPDSVPVAETPQQPAKVAYGQGHLATIREYYEQVLAIEEKLIPDHLDLAWGFHCLGELACQQGDWAAAWRCYQRALTIREKLAPESLFVASSLHDLGQVAYLQGDLTAAKEYFRRALSIREKVAPNSRAMAESLHDLALVAHKQGDVIEAERLERQAWELMRQKGAMVTGDEARQAFGVSAVKYAAALMKYQLALGHSSPAFLTLEEGRAQALQQLLIERQLVASAIDKNLWSAYRMAVADRDRAEAAVSRASVAEAFTQQEMKTVHERGAAPEPLQRAQTALQAATKQFEETRSAYTLARIKADQLWVEIKKSAPRAYAPPLTLEQAQRSLPPGTLFVSFSTDEEKTLVFLLPTGNSTPSESAIRNPQPAIENPISAYTVEITLDQLQRLVDRFRVEVNTRSRRTARAMAGRLLFAKLFPTEARPLIDRAQRVLISPDGPLWDVPFAALVTNAVGPPHYLGADKPITYTQSLTLFAQARNDAPQLAQGGTAHALVVGHPVFDRTSTEGARPKTQNSRLKTQVQDPKRTTQPLRTFTSERSYLFINGQPPEPLPETKTEAMEIAKLYGGEFLIEKQATEAAVRERIGQADVIHLATHGYLNPVRAMSSGVLLTAPETEPDLGQTANDGALQAWEIYSQLKLKAELVVLSACETGRGQKVRGEGLVGLTRALQYAGARSMVASQWKVSDKSTADLMVAFHQFLRQGMAKDDALRQAMETVRRQKRTAHPYFWAAFVLIGDPDNPHLGVEEVNQ
jgi:CHAT domain-containing protein/tetratricopeptide (TPR) repeat protein